MKNFFIKHFLRLQSAIRLLIIESTAVEIFGKEKSATFEAVFSRTRPFEEKKQPRNEDKSVGIYLHTPQHHFMPAITNYCARNP